MVRDRSPEQYGDPLVGSQDRGSLVGWGIGEDELREQSSGSVEALGIFLFGLRRIPYRSMGWMLARSRRAACDVAGAGRS